MLRRVSLMTSRANELANPIGQYGEPEPPQQPELRELLLQRAGTPRGDIINTKIIGNWLTSVCGRIHNGMRIELVKGKIYADRRRRPPKGLMRVLRVLRVTPSRTTQTVTFLLTVSTRQMKVTLRTLTLGKSWKFSPNIFYCRRGYLFGRPGAGTHTPPRAGPLMILSRYCGGVPPEPVLRG